MKKEPIIKVGLIEGAQSVRFALAGGFVGEQGTSFAAGDYTAAIDDGVIKLGGATSAETSALSLSPVDFNACRVTVHDVTIGVDFHWQRQESQQFQGALRLVPGPNGLKVINELPLEFYLVSVISSEMSASCPPELLRAHAVVSRSWLLAQLKKAGSAQPASQANQSSDEIIRWYDRESHADFDVCADDHCQRYQGISKAFSQAAFEAIVATRGKALVWNGEVCDTRYSKSCGGMTEVYRAAWEDKDVPYLPAIYDAPGAPAGYGLPLTVEENARQWITSSPPAYCNAHAPELLARVLPGFDQETHDFYRWQVVYPQDELREILQSRSGVDFGRVRALEPLERGESGRIIRLKIVGEKRTLVIGKELEIRRALSRSHLYSSAFVVAAEHEPGREYPDRFRLIGAGWGHGVGLCQIGAAVMADRGHSHEEILAHYFRVAALERLY